MSAKSADQFSKRFNARISAMSGGDKKATVALVKSVVDLCKQDRKGKVKSFSDDEIATTCEIINFKTLKKQLPESDIENIVDTLLDPDRMSAMHRLNKKQLVNFLVSLSDKQATQLTKFLVPFFTSYSEKFIQCLSTDQKAEVWGDLMPHVLSWLVEQDRTALLLDALFDRADIARALEFVEKERGETDPQVAA
jgi:hypothetical protein